MKINQSIACFCLLISSFSYGQDAQLWGEVTRRQENLIQQEQQRQRAMQEAVLSAPTVRIPSEQLSLSPEALLDEGPCFQINQVRLEGELSPQFQFALRKGLSQIDYQSGDCLSAGKINQLMVHAQNAVIDQGYTTTRILASPQDLKTGELVLTVIPGKIHEISYQELPRDRWQVQGNPSLLNEFPTKSGRILNLRDLEQGLENMNRLPTASAQMEIVPSASPNESDILIDWRQRVPPYRLSFNFDNSGSKYTGKYQGSVTFFADNPLGLSDLFYFSYQQQLGGKQDHSDEFGKKTKSGTRNYAAHYSVPIGNWQLFSDYSRYIYHQAVAGEQQNYDYNGRSEAINIGLQYLLYRDSHRKTNMTGKVWRRQQNSYIDDTEIDVQKRRTAGFEIGVNHTEYLGRSALNLGLNYRWGTGIWNSMPAPEEAFGEGTSRMKLFTVDTSLYTPFELGQTQWSYEGSFHGQWNKTPLVPQDQIAIGGRYTVRGFDGELSLMSERGWYQRNTLSWHYLPTHQAYIGLDVGHVFGPSSQYLLGKTLSGSVLGVRGQVKAGGSLYYDLFVGTPVYKPTGFKTDQFNLGFQFNYSF